MADYSGCRSRNTRGVFPAPSSCHRFLGVWSTPGKYFRGGTLLLSNETVANRRLRSQPVSDMAIYLGAIALGPISPRHYMSLRAQKDRQPRYSDNQRAYVPPDWSRRK